MARTRISAFTSTVKNARPAAADSPLAGELFVNYPDKQLGIVNAGATTNTDLIAVRFFATTTDYAIGDYVINAGQLYRANVAITAGAFTPANWTIVGGSGGGISDGDKGDIVVSGTGATWLFDSAVVTAAAKTVLDDTTVAAMRTTLGAEAALPAGGTTSNFLRGDKTWQAVPAAGAPLDSPAFTGNPTAPTPTAGDNDTSLATTAFVKAAVDAAIAALPVRDVYYDLATLASKDIAVPAWAKGVEMIGAVYSSTTSLVQMRVSFDGTTFPSGASDYQNVGGLHAGGTAAFSNNALASASSIALTLSSDSVSFPHAFDMQMNLVRPATGAFFHSKTNSHTYDSAAASLYRQQWWSGNPVPALSTALAIKALRLFPFAGTFAAGSYVHVRWLGDPSAPVGPVVGDPQYFYAGTGSPGGTATQNNNLITVGARVTFLTAGKITGVRWYNGTVDSATDGKVAVYSDAGTLLTSQAFSGLSTAVGWRLVTIPDYVITSGQTYRIAVWHKLGPDSHSYYMAQSGKFTSAGITIAGVMTMPVGPVQNVFFDASNSDITFPSDSFGSTGYGVDVEFRTIT